MSIFKKKQNVEMETDSKSEKEVINKLNEEILLVMNKMEGLEPDTEKYSRMAKNLETLCSASEKATKVKVPKDISAKGNVRNVPSWDTMITVAGSLLGIVMIIYGEETRIITTKALGFVIKGRV